MSRSSSPEPGVRLNRYLASCGLGSRRKCEDLIREGQIEINGKVIIDLATRVQPDDYVRYGGKVVRPEGELTILLNKPKGYLCTKDDPERRQTIYELLPPKFRTLSYVGRLDADSYGLLLMTNSGMLNETLTHPRHAVQKEYHVTLNRGFDPDRTYQLLEGMPFSEGVAKAESVHFFSRKRLTIVLTQGFNRQIRRMFARLDYKVRELERIRIGGLTAPDLSTGSYRVLNPRDIEAASHNPAPSGKKPPTQKRPPRRGH